MKRFSIKTLAIVALLFVTVHLYAQYQISGRIMQKSEKESPLALANVELRTADSVYMDGTTGDANGNFRFKNVAAGNYRITVSYLGFTSQTIVLNGLSKSVDLGNIFMAESVNQLKDITVTASNTINKTDRLVMFITDQQKEHSSNGINLLTTMQLPRLMINPLTNEVKLPGDESIQFCINDVKVDPNDIKALQPKDIIRVEYLDNPGLRYGNASVVINYILKRETTGGSFNTDLQQALTTGFSDDMVAFKINHKKSEFGLNYSLRYRKPTKIYANEERIFNFLDGSSLTRISNGLPSDMREEYHNFALNYNLMDKQYYFNATFRFSGLFDDKIRYNSQYTTQVPSDILQVQQGGKTRQFLPSMDLYYYRSLKDKQSLVLNVVGTYIRSTLNQIYDATDAGEPVSNILSDVAGKKYSIIGEGIYEKMFENNNRFTAGLKHTQAFANNDYTGTETALTKMNQAETYVYAEYAGKKDKFNYIGGVGLSRSYAQQEGESDYTTYTFRPKITLQYDFTNSTFLRLRGEIYNSTPSLSDISAVDQYVDTLQIIRGNPMLKPNLNYSTNLQFNWKKRNYEVNFYSNYIYSPNAIMEEVLRENDKFILTNENQKNWQQLNSELTLSANSLFKYFMLSLTGGMNNYVSDGIDYSHTYTNLYFRAQVVAMYKKFTGVFQLSTPYNRLMGETMYTGEKIHLFMFSYKTGNCNIGAGIMLPFFNQYTRYATNYNVYMPYHTSMYANDFARMILVKFSWNFDFGRKMQSENKRVNNSDSDAGIVRTDK